MPLAVEVRNATWFEDAVTWKLLHTFGKTQGGQYYCRYGWPKDMMHMS